jgi:hypothetical protein
MPKVKIICPHCGCQLQYEERYAGRKIKCLHCRTAIPILLAAPLAPLPPASASIRKPVRGWKRKLMLAGAALLLLPAAGFAWCLLAPATLHWPDRRPIGVLFLASGYHSSATNPRGWFNDPTLNVTGSNGPAIFRQALLEYTDRSLAVLKRLDAQGVIVWDLEGEQYPHKTTFIGDPRLLAKLAPEMAPVADEFFDRLRGAGFRVGLTIRPQQLVFDEAGWPRQTPVVNIQRLLLDKIDYARSRWQASLFYLDSNAGWLRPDEWWQLRAVAAKRPGILLMPEHSWPPYGAFSAPYVSVRNQRPALAAQWARHLFPESFRALNIGDAGRDQVALVWRPGDILLFRAWYWNSDCQVIEDLAPVPPTPGVVEKKP